MKKTLLSFTILLLILTAFLNGQAQTTIDFQNTGHQPYDYIGSPNLDLPIGAKTMRFNYNNAASYNNYYINNTPDGTSNLGLEIAEETQSDALTISYTDNSAFSLNALKVFDYEAAYYGYLANQLTLKAYNGSTLTATYTYTPSGAGGTNLQTINTLSANAAFGNVTKVVITAAIGFYHLFDDVVIGNAPLSINFLTSSTSNGTYKTGDVIPIQINFTAPVTVTGTPQLQLETGTTDQVINYASGSGTSTLTFNYTVQAGNNSADLDYLSTTALSLNGGTITNGGGTNANLTLPAPGTAGSLGANKNMVIDGVAPTVAITSNVSALKKGEAATITFTFSENPGSTFTWNGLSGDLTVTGGTLSAISGSGLTRTATFTPTAATNNGTASISVAAGSYTDLAGNTGSAGTTPSLTFDTQAPTINIASNASALKKGESATITFTFSEDPGSTFTWNGLSGDVTVTGGTLSAVSGTGLTRTATFTPTAATDYGTASISVAAGSYTDLAGNNGEAGTTPSLAFDTQAPTTTVTSVALSNDTGTSGTDLITNTAAQTISGTLSANLLLGEIVEVSVDNGGSYQAAITSAGANTWSIASTISASNTFKIRVTDLAGNVGTTFSAAYVLDTQAPTINITSNVNTLKTGETATITFTFNEDPGSSFAWDGSAGSITVTGGTLSAISGTGLIRTSTFTPAADTNNGTASISVATGTYTDVAGNSGPASSSLSISFDTLLPNAPAVPILAAGSDTGTSGDNITSITTPTFTGTAEANSAVTLYDTNGTTVLATATADGSGNWQAGSSALAEGSHNLTAKATDAAGNISAASAGLTILIDHTAPNVPAVTSPANNATILVATPVISGTAESGSVVTINIDGTVVSTAVTTDVSGNWTFTASALPNGPHAVKALATDVSGNASAYSSTSIFNINISPTITATGTLSALASNYGVASSSTSFTVSGVNMAAGVLITPPAGFEVSTDNVTFSTTVMAGAAGVISQIVYVRLKSTASANTYSGNIILSSAGATAVTEAIPNSIVFPVAISITADVKSKTYGDADPAFTYAITAGALVGSDALTGALTRGPGESVNTYAISQGNLTAGSNYTLAYVPANLTINKRAVTVTADAKSKTYGDTEPALTYSITSGTIANADTFAGALTRAAGESAGTYAINSGTLALGNNYTLTYQPANLTISKKELTITAANQTKTYGMAIPVLTVSYSGFVNGDSPASFGTAPTITTTATSGSNVDIYPITLSGAVIPNYTTIYVPGTLTITKAALSITADNKTRIFGAANPPLTVSYSGFVNGDSNNSLASLPTITTTATTTSAAGTYPITASGATAANYNFVYVPGTLTVTGASVTSFSLAQVNVLENQPSGAIAGTLNATSADPNAAHTYTLVSGAGSTDNAAFTIQGDKLIASKSFDFEQQGAYSVRLRATNQYGLYLEQSFTVNITDVNEAPTLAAISAQQVCYQPVLNTIRLSGITPGPEGSQSTTLTVSTSDFSLFGDLRVSAVSGGAATLSYQLARPGSATVTVSVQDNGGTANGGTDSFSQSFTISSNEAPIAEITSDKGTKISKGETVTLTVTGGSAYNWDTSPNVSGTSSSAIIRVRPAQTTTYQVTVSTGSGCSATKSITIQVADDYAMIDAANILTPNGDGKNDTWVVKNLDLYPNNTVSIFDKSGRKLYQARQYSNTWDGSVNGSPLTEGNYYYVIDFGEGKGLKKGFITILRNR
jgi:gliding motility-associated-like protein